MLPSGYLIRPCEGGGSMIHIVDHVDLDVSGIDIALSNLEALTRSLDLNKNFMLLSYQSYLLVGLECTRGP